MGDESSVFSWKSLWGVRLSICATSTGSQTPVSTTGELGRCGFIRILSFRRKPESREINELDPGFRQCDELISASLSLEA